MPNGFCGRTLFVDLSTGSIKVEQPAEEVYRRFLGGYGIGVLFLYRRIPAGAEPLGPENILAFLPGLLTGSGAQFSGRFMVSALSPLTGGWADANCGGNFGPALRAAGYDALFISGKAAKPVYLYLDEQKTEIRPASHLWGLDVRQTEKKLHEELSSEVKIACIGPAGEKLSLIAGIVNDDGRLAARCGLGAVMGSKNIKAVAAQGRSRPSYADQKTFRAVSAEYLKLFRRKPSTMSGRIPAIMSHMLPFFRRFRTKLSSGPAEMVVDSYRRYGTAAGTATLVELGDAPIRNWKGIGYRDFPLRLSEGLSDKAVVQPMIKTYACHSCPVACGGIMKQPDGSTSHKAEYETLASFGPLLLNGSLENIMSCSHVCSMAGLDSISTGVVIAFALDCAENGWLPAELVNELPLSWGNGEVILELTKRIAERRPGLGDWLADGVQKAAKRLPAHAHQSAMHAGGQELAMHRGIYEPGVAAGYAFDPAPGRHTSTNAGNAELTPFAPFFELLGIQPARRYDYPGEGITQGVSMCLYRAFDSLGLCQFSLLMGNPPFLEWLNAATGWDVSRTEFLQIGKRIQVLRHAFNARHGLPAQFKLPKRELGEPPQTIGPVANRTLDMEAMAKTYFKFLGVDPGTGLPLPETARELNLEFVPST